MVRPPVLARRAHLIRTVDVETGALDDGRRYRLQFVVALFGSGFTAAVVARRLTGVFTVEDDDGVRCYQAGGLVRGTLPGLFRKPKLAVWQIPRETRAT